jgi:hypothetical protein
MTMKTFYEIGRESGTDKIYHHRYDRFYPRFLEELRNESFSMLEIGIDQSCSLNLWKEYFPFAKIYGLDIGVDYQDERCRVFKGDQSKEEDLEFLISNLEECRFIIDDGSHNPSHQFLTFVKLFDKVLSPGGIYIIEDIECNYWRPDSWLYGYMRGHFNLMEILKSYPDSINSKFSRKGNHLKISSITFGQNCVIITKMTLEEEKNSQKEYGFKENL